MTYVTRLRAQRSVVEFGLLALTFFYDGYSVFVVFCLCMCLHCISAFGRVHRPVGLIVLACGQAHPQLVLDAVDPFAAGNDDCVLTCPLGRSLPVQAYSAGPAAQSQVHARHRQARAIQHLARHRSRILALLAPGAVAAGAVTRGECRCVLTRHRGTTLLLATVDVRGASRSGSYMLAQLGLRLHVFDS